MVHTPDFMMIINYILSIIQAEIESTVNIKNNLVLDNKILQIDVNWSLTHRYVYNLIGVYPKECAIEGPKEIVEWIYKR